MDAILEEIRIAGISVAVPKNRQAVHDSGYETEEVRKRFTAATGIKERRLCLPNQYGSDLARAAAESLLDTLCWDRKDVHALIYVTQTPDLTLPATTCVLQHRLDLPTECACFDINLGCSGYPYGIYTAGRFIPKGSPKKVLLLVGDIAGKPKIPSRSAKTAPLFGDAISATGLEWSAEALPMFFQFRTEGSGWQVIMERRPGGRPPIKKKNFFLEEDEAGNLFLNTSFQMKGEDVFNFSVRTVPGAIEDILKFAGRERDEIDAFVLHQANKMINEFIRKRLNMEPGLFPSTLEKFGNTSSATIPITMLECFRERLTTQPAKLVLCGFGVGLSWATAYMETDPMVIPKLVEI